MRKASHQQKVEAIRATGLSYADIAERCGVDVSTIFRIRQGSIADPRYSVGLAIDDLHSSTHKKKARHAA